ncbi:hypothetical protein CC78DRAFT_326909 [Lojkania enalia]|uniref:Uncharacterized protein n=1 Tax=Lojkania enalia TaxID=147567 RepID=A0A9P4K360_9PLEO|nr:hypothetical protein CC78DRAFT_326909 [Didymosphaeria enalia]
MAGLTSLILALKGLIRFKKIPSKKKPARYHTMSNATDNPRFIPLKPLGDEAIIRAEAVMKYHADFDYIKSHYNFEPFRYLKDRHYDATMYMDDVEDPKFAPKGPCYILNIPPELRVQIFRILFRNAFVETFGSSTHLYIQETPWHTSGRPNVQSLFLINKLLHDEAEEALWKSVDVVLHSYWHYKFPYRFSASIFALDHLSTFAYASIRKIDIPINIQIDNNFAYIRNGYNRFEKFARSLKGLRLATFHIVTLDDTILASHFTGLPSHPKLTNSMAWVSLKAPKVIAGIVSLFEAEKVIVVMETEQQIKNFRSKCKPLMRYKFNRIELRLGDMDRWKAHVVSDYSG